MITINASIDSIILGRPVNFRVCVPYNGITKISDCIAMWCFHCAMKNGSFFFDELGLGKYVDACKMAIIAPDLANSFFVDTNVGDVGYFITNEFIPCVSKLLNLSSDHHKHYALGISMGAFGIANLAFLNPTIFSKIFCISGIYDFTKNPSQNLKTNSKQKSLYMLLKRMVWVLYNEDGNVRENCDIKKSILKYIDSTHTLQSGTPEISIFCGDGDILSFDQTIDFKNLLDEKGIYSSLSIETGGHDTKYWDKTIRKIFSRLTQK